MTTPPTDPLSRWLAFKDHLSVDLFGGPRPLKLATVVNLQKGATMLWVLGLIAWFDAWDSPSAWTYLGLHGTYGLCWLLKDALFPDPSWERRVTLGGAFMAWALVLAPYWSFPVLMIARGVEHSPAFLGFTIVLHTLGVVLMMGADGQKYFTLKVKRGLITSGFFGRVRHPNYLGEMMLYGAYGLLAWHWSAWAILLWVWLGVFVPNMIAKERSMSRYPQWAAYVARTGMILPKLGAQAPLPEDGAAGATVPGK